MKKLNNDPIRLLAALFVLSFAACSSMQVNTAKAPNADLSKYRTYAWAKQPAQSLPQHSIFDQSVKTDAERQLAMKGLKPAVTSPPDLLISYAAGTRTSYEYSTGPGYWGPGYAYPVREGELSLFFLDPKTNEVVWQGTAADVIGNAGENQKQIAEAVTSIIQKYPAA